MSSKSSAVRAFVHDARRAPLTPGPARPAASAGRRRRTSAGTAHLVLAVSCGVALLFCAAAASSGGAGPEARDPLAGTLVPRPGLSPGEVIRIQLEALRNNDDADRGIEVAFRFASPANRAHTGPLPRFIRMIRQGPYALMLDHHTATYGMVRIIGDHARQQVTLTGARARVSYWFFLSRQEGAPCEGCWMTDAVHVERVRERKA